MVLGEPNIYHNLGMFYKNVGDFTWRVSDCEELVGFIQYVCVVVFSYGVLLQLFQKLLD